MTAQASQHRLAVFTLCIFWICILLGIGIPWSANVAVDMFKHGQTLEQALHQLRLHLFAPGYNLYLIAAINAGPFIVFSIFVLLHLGLCRSDNRKLVGRRGAAIFFTMMGLIGLSAWTHVTTLWFPDAQGALVYLFLPFLLLLFIPIGYALGRGLGILLFRA